MAESDSQQLLLETRRISRFLIEVITKDMNQSEKIELLNRVGYEPREIAPIVGTTPNSVRVTMSNLRKQKKSKKAKE